MLRLEIDVDNVNFLYQLGYRHINIERAATISGTCVSGTIGCYDPYILGSFTALTDMTIDMIPGRTYYSTVDREGTYMDWYRWYYTKDTVDTTYSGVNMLGPTKGSLGDHFYSPLYPPEVNYTDKEISIIKRLRSVIGDPISLKRDYGELMYTNVHQDNMTYELQDKGWPVDITINGIKYNEATEPVVHNYKYLQFYSDITEPVTISGITYSIDIWYYTFRHSDREIIEQWSMCPVPPGLNKKNCPEEAYILQTGIDLLLNESFEDSIEAAATVSDEGTSYSPDFSFRQALLDMLKKRLDDLIKQYKFIGTYGIRIE